jgi:hypothetical protein
MSAVPTRAMMMAARATVQSGMIVTFSICVHALQ